MGSNIAFENTYEKVLPKPEKQPKMLMASPPPSAIESDIPNPTSVSNIKLKATNAQQPDALRRTRINSSRIVDPTGREIYTSQLGGNSQLKVHRSKEMQVSNDIKSMLGGDSANLRMQHITLQGEIEQKRIIHESLYQDESYEGKSNLETIQKKGQPTLLDFDVGEIAVHGTTQVKTYLYDRNLHSRIQAH